MDDVKATGLQVAKELRQSQSRSLMDVVQKENALLPALKPCNRQRSDRVWLDVIPIARMEVRVPNDEPHIQSYIFDTGSGVEIGKAEEWGDRPRAVKRLPYRCDAVLDFLPGGVRCHVIEMCMCLGVRRNRMSLLIFALHQCRMRGGLLPDQEKGSLDAFGRK